MTQSSLATLMPLDISGTLSTSGAEVVGIILAVGIVIALIGKFWFMPYLDYRQKIGGKPHSTSAKSKSRKATDISQHKVSRKD